MTLRCGAAVVACRCAPLDGSPPRDGQQPAHGARSRFPSAVARAHSRAAVAACRIMIYTKESERLIWQQISTTTSMLAEDVETTNIYLCNGLHMFHVGFQLFFIALH